MSRVRPQPGEKILLRVAQLDAGVVVLEAGYLRTAPGELQADVVAMLNDSFITGTDVPAE